MGLWLLALGLRFWGLGRFNTLVFDEIYFAKFAQNYLTQTPFFDAHPPLGKYLIALGIALEGFNPWGFRWMNALVGSWIPLIGIGLAFQLTRRTGVALLCGFLLCLDGLFLVESRYALLNIYLVFFGLAGQLCLMLAITAPGWRRRAWIVLAGLLFGATVSVKWNGLGLLFGFHLLWLIVVGVGGFRQILQKTGLHRSKVRGLAGENPSKEAALPLQNLRCLTFFDLFILLPLVALIVYGLQWIPHLMQNPGYNLWRLNYEMFAYHSRVGSGAETHAYCSTWYSWPLMLRPVSYFFERALSLAEPLPILGPTLPMAAARYFYSVYAMGNPVLWWFSTLALLWVLGRGLIQLGCALFWTDSAVSSLASWVYAYLGVNYLANLLPWAAISRCAFIYHYLPASFFGTLALGWAIVELLRSRHGGVRQLGFAVLGLCVGGFLFWLPFFLGLPLTPEAWRLRLWFASWI